MYNTFNLLRHGYTESEGSAQFHSKGCNILLLSFLHFTLVQTKLV